MTLFPEEISDQPDEACCSSVSLELNSKNEQLPLSISKFVSIAGADVLRTLCLRGLKAAPAAFGQALSESCINLEYLDLVKMGAEALDLKLPNLVVLNLTNAIVRTTFDAFLFDWAYRSCIPFE